MTSRDEALSYLSIKIKQDEPVFVLRAQDIHAPYVIGVWISQALRSGSPDDTVQEALDCALQMRSWQDENDIKNPD